MLYVTKNHPMAAGRWALCEDGRIVEVFGYAAPMAVTASGDTVAPTSDRERGRAIRALLVADGWDVITAAAADGTDMVPWSSDPAIAYVGVQTSDKRMIDSLAFRAFPLPLMVNRETTPWGHDGAVLVGRMDVGAVDGENVTASGVIDAGREDGADVVRLMMSDQLRGVSIDGGPRQVTMDIIEMDEEGWPINWVEHYVDYMCMGVTLTPFPAFDGTKIKLDSAPSEAAPPPATGASSRKRSGLGGRGSNQYEEKAGGAEENDTGSSTSEEADAVASNVADAASQAVEVQQARNDAEDNDAPQDEIDQLDQEYNDIIDSAANDLANEVNNSDNPEELLNAVEDSLNNNPDLDSLSSSQAEEILRNAKEMMDHLTASAFNPNVIVITASGDIPVEPPLEWFDNPELDGLTRWTVQDDGRVFGHLAPWGQCHVGIQDQCVMAPKSQTAYGYFMLGRIRCATGCQIDIGTITFGTGHADKRLTARAAAAHYDNTGTAAADVVVGEDAFGVWVAGALRPMEPPKVREVRAAKLSGDWRAVNGNLELIAALAVNVPGFPTYEENLNNTGEVETMIASLMPAMKFSDEASELDLIRRQVNAMSRVMRPVLDSEAERLRARVHVHTD